MALVDRPLRDPYIGPRPFGPHDQLYGRERETERLRDLLIAERIVLLYSPSGAGKTSLINASLIPAMQAENFDILPPLRVSRGLPPEFGALDPPPNRYVLGLLTSLAEQDADVETLARTDLSQYLLMREQRMEVARNTVLIFDQFEEVLTLDAFDVAAKRELFQQIGAALRNPSYWALFSMREEYAPALEPYLRPIPTRLSTRFRLDLLTREQAGAAIRAPAERLGVAFTDDAIEKLVDELSQVRVEQADGEPDVQRGIYVEPVQLQVVCRQLWDRQKPRPGACLTAAEINVQGNVDDALASYYSDVVLRAAACPGVTERAVREWFDHRLILAHGIRGQALRSSIASDGLTADAVRVLEEGYLIRPEGRSGATWFELAHDRLVAPVRRDNAAWYAAHLSPLQKQSALWDQQDQPQNLLLAGADLAAAVEWAANNQPLRLREERFLSASIEAGRARRQQRWSRINRRIAIVMTTLFVLAVVATLAALYLYQVAENQSRIASVRALAAAAMSNLDVDPELSVLLSRQAVLTTQRAGLAVLPEAQTALQRAVQASRIRLIAPVEHQVWNRVAFSPDGVHMAAGGGNGAPRIWDVREAGAQPSVLESAGLTGIEDVAYSGDGKRVAAADQRGVVQVWDVDSGRPLLQVHFDEREHIALTGDGSRLAAAGGTNVTIRNVDSGTEEWRHPLDTGARKVVFSPDGRALAVADGRAVKLLDAATGALRGSLEGHADDVVALAFSPDGARIVSGSDDYTVRIWDTATGRVLLDTIELTTSILDLTFDPTGTYVSVASAAGTVGVFRTASGFEAFTLRGHSNTVSAVSFSPDGSQIETASWDGTVRVWDASDAHAGSVDSVAFSPDGTRLVSGGRDKLAKVWDTTTGQLVLTIPHPYNVVVGGVTPDGSRVLTSSGGSAFIWDIATGRKLLAFDENTTNNISNLRFSHDGRLVAIAGYDATASVWDAATGAPQHTLEHPDIVYDVSFSPDDRLLATAGADGFIRVWDFATEHLVMTFDNHHESDSESDILFSIQFSPDGSLIGVANADGSASIWNAHNEKEPAKTLMGHRDNVVAIAFDPSGTRVATAGFDGTARVWDVASGRETMQLAHRAPVNAVAFHPKLDQLITATADGMTHRYALGLDDLLVLSSARIMRSLTPAECATYLTDGQCPKD